MREEYKFAGFSSDIALFAEVERYGVHLVEGVLAGQPDRHHWPVIELMDDGRGKDELVRLRFAVSPGTVSVGFRNSTTQK